MFKQTSKKKIAVVGAVQIPAGDTPEFHPHTLHEMWDTARGRVLSADGPYEAFVWACFWCSVAEATEGKGLTLTNVEDSIVNMFHPDFLLRADNEATILYQRKQSGRCFQCGGVKCSEAC